MISVTFNSATAYLLSDLPDWAAMKPELNVEIPAFAEGGLTARESRFPLGDTLRCSLAYAVTLEGSAINTLRNSLQAITTERVLCPLWPAGFEAGASPTVTADYYALIDDSGNAPEIKTHAQLPFARRAYPLMVGILESAPDPALLSGNVATVQLRFVENDAWTITPPAYSATNALNDGSGAARPLFPFRPNWNAAPMAGKVERTIDRTDIGQSRTLSPQYFEQRSRRTPTQFFTLTDSQPWQLMRFFLTLAGVRNNFWLPSGIAEAQLSGNVTAGDSVLNVSDETAIGDNEFVVLDDLTNREAVKVSNSTPGELAITAGTLTQNYVAAQTRVESLMLARFASTKLTLRFQSPAVAAAQIQFREVPWETTTVSGETHGTTIGPIAPVAYLYEFSIDYGDAQTYYRFTDFERDLTDSGNTFKARPSSNSAEACWMEHGEIVESDDMQRQEVDLTSSYFTGNPLALFMPMQLERTLKLDIYEARVSGNSATNVERVFRGEVTEVSPEPPRLRARAQSLSALFDRRIPFELIQTGCNTTLFSAKCGLSRNDWKWTGLVTSYNAATRTLVLNTVARVSGSAIALPEGRFAGGECIVGSGSSSQRRALAGNTALSSGNITLYVGTAFTTAPAVGATVTFHPGCPGRYQQDCIDFYSNGANFRGFPWMPAVDPKIGGKDFRHSSGQKK